jgi:hypothetical protein
VPDKSILFSFFFSFLCCADVVIVIVENRQEAINARQINLFIAQNSAYTILDIFEQFKIYKTFSKSQTPAGK